MKSFVILKENARDASLTAEYLRERNYDVLCATTNYLEALGVLCKQKPDFAIIDTCLDDTNGLEFSRCIKKRSPQTYCIVCLPVENFSIKIFFQYDVNAYLATDHSLSELLQCLRSLQDGYRYICPGIAQSVNSLAEAQEGTTHYDLSNQERKVLQMLGTGLTPKEITEKLFITIHTLNNHKTKIRNKLNLRSNRELIFFALRNMRSLQCYS
jgi:DNA-binding NarL/FixJ family response regulator